MRYIAVDKIREEGEKLIDRGKYYDHYDSAWRDGNNCACHAMFGIIDRLAVNDSIEINIADDKIR